MNALLKALIIYLEANPTVCEISASVSKNGEGIESINIKVKDAEDKVIDSTWQEFRQEDKLLDPATLA